MIKIRTLKNQCNERYKRGIANVRPSPEYSPKKESVIKYALKAASENNKI